MQALSPLLIPLCLGFAPAPFPKTTVREGAGQISLQTFQGTWKVVSMEAVNEKGGRKPIHWNVKRLRVEGGQLTYLGDDRDFGRDRVAIDARKKPALIDFYSQDRAGSKPYRVGLIKMDRGRIVLLFYQTEAENRAKSFDNPPPFWWWAVLERVR
jgi:uncharacterized protein (TIGR03067 family)